MDPYLLATLIGVPTLVLTFLWLLYLPQVKVFLEQAQNPGGFPRRETEYNLMWQISATIVVTLIALFVDWIARFSPTILLHLTFWVNIAVALVFNACYGKPGKLTELIRSAGRIIPPFIAGIIYLTSYLWYVTFQTLTLIIK